MWSFGFGSNLDRVALETKKHVKILDESAAILKDWKFSYISGIPFAEPAYANVEVNGLQLKVALQEYFFVALIISCES